MNGNGADRPFAQMLVKVVDKDGIREIDYDDSKPVASA